MCTRILNMCLEYPLKEVSIAYKIYIKWQRPVEIWSLKFYHSLIMKNLLKLKFECTNVFT